VIRYIRCVVLKDPRVRMSRRQVSISPDDEGEGLGSALASET
jgi:hypothetical protein